MVYLTIWEYRNSQPLTRLVPYAFAFTMSKSPYFRVKVVSEWDELMIDTNEQK